MNPNLSKLQPYPFEKLRQLFAQVTPAELTPIALSVGEPKHASPIFVQDALQSHWQSIEQYSATKGIPELRETIAQWLQNRFQLQQVDADSQVLPVNGTREALFAIVQAVFDAGNHQKPYVLSPNPFYQIYEGAAILAGAEPVFLPCTAEHNFSPDFDSVTDETWQKTQILFICSPGNPSGAVLSSAQLQSLIKLADEHDFVIASDECYSEIYGDQPPPGLLQACAEMGRHDFHRCLVFHSLSKRSNLPGLRSGFVAGDAGLMEQFLLYRTYHGCAMPFHHQHASIAAWQDESHVQFNRDLYQAKFDKALSQLTGPLEIYRPDAGFYLWAKTPEADADFARKLFEQQHIKVLPGSFLSREVDGQNPGAGYVRMALVAAMAEWEDAIDRINEFLRSNY
mgnify:CR=1 FL=1